MTFLLKSISLAVLVSSAHPLTPDGGKWHHPGSPFIVTHQIPTRHVGKGGTRLQSDPYGMPSYGRLHDNAFRHDEGFTAVADFERPSQNFHQRAGPSHNFHHTGNVGSNQSFRRRGPFAPPPPPPQELQIPEFERQSYVRMKEDFGKGEDENFFFAGRPNYQYGAPGFEEGMPIFFQQAPADFFTGRPTTSFHGRPIRPNFY